MRKLALILSVLALAASGQELVLNGGFEDAFNHWEQEVNSPEGSYEFTRGTNYRPGPDYSARIYKYMRYSARLLQDVDIPGTDARFAAEAKLLASKGATTGYYAYAAMILEYLNSGGSVLGRTAILNKVGDWDPQNSPTERFVLVTGENWERYELIIAEELEYLSGVNPADVTAIRIALESYGTGASG